MTEREKMIEIIAPFVSAYGEDEVIADALIAANIGDVTEYKKTIRDLNTDVVAYRALSKADTLEQIIEGQKSLMDEYKHRAEIAERKYMIELNKYAKCDRKLTHYNKMTTTYDKEITKQAGREIEEEKGE